jgi:hypothetical protein
LVLQDHVGVHALELGQLRLKLLESPEMVWLHVRILLSPFVERGLYDAVRTADVGDIESRFNFGNDANDLVLDEVGFLHGGVTWLNGSETARIQQFRMAQF